MKRNKYNLCLNITHCYCYTPRILGKRKDLFRFWRLWSPVSTQALGPVLRWYIMAGAQSKRS